MDPPGAREFAKQVVPGVGAYGEYEKGNYIYAAGLITLDVATLGNPGSKDKAQDIVKQTSREFDKQYDTDLAGAAKKVSCIGTRILRD